MENKLNELIIEIINLRKQIRYNKPSFFIFWTIGFLFTLGLTSFNGVDTFWELAIIILICLASWPAILGIYLKPFINP